MYVDEFIKSEIHVLSVFDEFLIIEIRGYINFPSFKHSSMIALLGIALL